MGKIALSMLGVFFLLIPPLYARAEQNVIIYGDSSYKPYAWDEHGRMMGIYSDILREADKLMPSYTLTLEPVPWQRGLKYLETGKGFALFPPYYRPKLRPYMDYSVPILREGYSILCAEEVDPLSRKSWPADYKQLRIGINTGYAVPKLEQAQKKYGVKIDATKSIRFNLLKLGVKRVDCYINDEAAMLYELKLMEESGEYSYPKHPKLIIGTKISEEYGYLGFTNRDGGKFSFKQDFIEKFNNAITVLKKNGKIKEIYEQYLK